MKWECCPISIIGKVKGHVCIKYVHESAHEKSLDHIKCKISLDFLTRIIEIMFMQRFS